jgi:aryl-alcohol dehydrogenase (NADP+)
MNNMNLGRTGLQVSRICLGCMTFGSKKWREWVLEEEESRLLIKKALDVGINFFDTANMYSVGVSEEIVGRALKDYVRREDVVIASKVYFPMAEGANRSGLSRKHIYEEVNASLRRLGTDYIDLYQIHRWDPNTPIEETLEALNDLVRAGKVLYIGASSMYAWQFAKALYTSDRHNWSRFVSMQNHYNLVYREEEREMLPLCKEEGIGVIPWSPLARGFLAGNRNRSKEGDTLRAKTDKFAQQLYFSENDFAVLERLLAVSQARETPSTQLALAWMLGKPAIVAPIIGVSKPEQIDDAVAALEISLTAEEVQSIEECYTPHAILGHQ